MSDLAMPESLKLVLEHLNAVRELDRYLRKKGMNKDVELYARDVARPALEARFPVLRLWLCDPDSGELHWYPEGWKLGNDAHVAVSVLFPLPTDLDDPNPSVNLWVPADWTGYAAFDSQSTDFVKKLLLDGFGLASKNNWVKDYPVGKYVDWLNSDGSFNEGDLIERIAVETEKILHLEERITEAIREAPAEPAHDKAKDRIANSGRK